MGQQSKVSTKQPNRQAECADQYERLDDLKCGRTAAKESIRTVLNELAAKYGLPKSRCDLRHARRRLLSHRISL